MAIYEVEIRNIEICRVRAEADCEDEAITTAEDELDTCEVKEVYHNAGRE